MGRLFTFDLDYYISNYNIKHFVETGTGEGDTLAALITYQLESYNSVEIHDVIYNRCVERFKENSHRVHLYNDNSIEGLKKMIQNISKDENILFWLDAHFPGADSNLSGYGTEKRDDIRIPLEHEIKLIEEMRSGCRDLIFIDDLRIYEDGPFSNGNWAERNVLGGNGIDFIYDSFSESHRINKVYNDEGYIILTPKS
jgi:hypothetical protein